MEKSKKPSNPVCYTPSSEHFRIYLSKLLLSNFEIVLRYGENTHTVCTTEHKSLGKLHGPKMVEEFEEFEILRDKELGMFC
jgi:hypothetical protein